MRTFLTAIGLGLAAWPLWRICESNVAPRTLQVSPAAVSLTTAATAIPFQLQLSSSARRIELRDENAKVLWQTTDSQNTEFIAQIERLPAQISMEISWSGTPAPRYFAKLRLDVPERASLIHVFDSSGDIDDLWELP